MKVLLRAVLALVCLAAIAPMSASAATGSYTDSSWSSPVLRTMRFWTNGGIITPPAGVPATATITSITGTLTWNNTAPSGSVYRGRLCDVADGEYNTSPVFVTGVGCVTFGAPTGNQMIAGVSTTGYTGKPAATTQIYYSAEADDGSTSTIHPVINPTRSLFSTGKSITVNYTY
jgi:hypothetical protein